LSLLCRYAVCFTTIIYLHERHDSCSANKKHPFYSILVRETMISTKDFQYIDFASKALPGFRNHIARVKELPGLIQRYGHTDCYCTYFLFDQGFLDYQKNNLGSLAGYQGQCNAPFLPFDIDSPDLSESLQTAREMTNYFLDGTGLPQDALAIYFSGSKGFHLTVSTAVFGDVEPSADLPRVFQNLRCEIVKAANLSDPQCVDFSISDRLRLFRLPYTRHSKSGLYKVPLKLEELLSCEPKVIREIARKPRPSWLTDESGLIAKYRMEPVPDAVELYHRSIERNKENAHSDLPDPGSFLNNGDLRESLCQAEYELYREGAAEGARSALCLRFASRFRFAGYSQDEASKMVESFAQRCRSPKDSREVQRIVAVAYQTSRTGYQFGCGTGNGDPAHTMPVSEKCRYSDRMTCDTYRKFNEKLHGRVNKGGF
jgi:hypothetical protein